MSRPQRIIDTHQHVFWMDRDDTGLVADMDEHGIEYAWLLTWEIAPWEDRPDCHVWLNPLGIRPDGTNRGITLGDVIVARDRYPHRFVLGYCPHPLSGNAPARLRSAVAIHGVQVCGEWKFRIPFDDPRCLELFHTAGELKLPVVLHLDVPYLRRRGQRTYQPLWYGGTIDNLARALSACRDTIFVGHAPGFWREISRDAESNPQVYPKSPITQPGRLHGLFDRHPNLYADLSAKSALAALRRDPHHAVRFLTRHQDRLLFGRDGYGQALHKFLQGLRLPKRIVAKIYWQNAEKLVAGPQ